MTSDDVNEDFVAPHFRGIAGYPHCWVLYNLAGSDVVLPAMPGTGHHLAVELSLAERASAMHAYIADGVELPLYIGERHRFALYLKLVDGARGDFGGFGGAHKWHTDSFASEMSSSKHAIPVRSIFQHPNGVKTGQ